VSTLFASGSIDEITQIWWSIRPHPLFGTLEVRICDCQSDIRDTLAIASLVMALAARLAADYDAGKKLDILSVNQVEENFWRAIRYGLDGGFIDYQARREIPAKKAVAALLDFTQPVQADLGLGKYLDRVSNIIDRGNGAQRQIHAYEELGDIAAVHRLVAGWTLPG
jgi:carboxylate-amine ligase